ncbi:uncharacterized protein EDB91DRAFT_1088677 [Suillus paluster]|uniref:uncharacterized protein n=1 Tax=Suillus paluster TaxID=48578 RepID=UPI001B8836F9|nr:uncharacterized protein EDB91DRAFT_1088677 [Suillus paluster]KAG1720862.1 hypothetical protein EDB91DRAFT_1088677 [Suillus paluster]
MIYVRSVLYAALRCCIAKFQSMPRQCTKPNCPRPKYQAGDKDKTHNNKYHSAFINVSWQGQTVKVSRHSDGRFHCPCGRYDHGRYDYHRFMKLLSKSPHPDDAASDCMDPDEDPSGEQESPQVANVGTELVQNHHDNSPDTAHYAEDSLCPHPDMDVDPSPAPEPPVNSIRAAVEARSHTLHQTASSSLTRFFKGNALTSVAHDVVTVGADLRLAEAHDEDVDSGSEDDIAPDDSGDDDDGLPAMDVDTESDPAELRAHAHAWGIHVDPTFNLTVCLDCAVAIPWEQAYGHRRRQHNPTGTSSKSLPSKASVSNTLRGLNAHLPKPLPTDPVPPIDGMRIIPNLLKCTIEGCTFKTLFTSMTPFHKHCVLAHGTPPLALRSHAITNGHQIGVIKNSMSYIEVASSPTITDSNALGAILAHIDECGLYSRDTKYQPAANKRPRGPLLAQTNWEQCIENVDLKSLRLTASKPDGEPAFQYLIQQTQTYYKFIAANLGRLSTLTLRAIASTSPSGNTEKAPFRRPQEDPTLERYANFMSRFIIFLIRHLCQPVDNFDVPLHPLHSHYLKELYAQLKSALNRSSVGADQHCIDLIHRTVFSLLSCVSDDFLKNEMKDLFTLFLVTYHLSDDYGNTNRAPQVPPTISQAQWCFRATAAYEIMEKMPYHENNSFKTYEVLVQRYLVDGPQTLFTGLRQKMALLSALSYSEPGLPRFGWNAEMTVVSIDGFPIPLKTFKNSVNSSLDDLKAKMDELFRGCQWDDILLHIDSRTDPNNPGNWFTDRPQSADQKTSVFSFKENGWDKYQRRLLEHLARDPRLFSRVKGEYVVNAGNVWEWLAVLNELSSIMFYCVVSTWGGGARGTECDHLKFQVDGQGDRQIFILNGLVTISTTYVKTASIQGHGKLIARCPSHSASRLLLVVLGVIYPAAAELATFVMSVEKAKAYLSYVFLHDGTPMNTHDFSQSIGAITQRYLGRALGMRDWRQLMSTMLINISKVDFGIVDEEDAGLLAIHDAFGHSQSVAEAHYALQSTNALTEISHTAVASMQRVSKRWHATIGQLQNGAKEASFDLHSAERDHEEQLFDRLLGPLKTTIHSATQQATALMGVDIVDELRNVATGMGHGILKEMEAMFHQYILALGITPKAPLGVPPAPSLPRISVHPNLIERLRPLFPGQPTPSFTSPQQAEVVQSCMTSDHVVCVMPTGSGKSLAFFAAPVLIPDSLFIVITPLVALTEDLARRLSSTTIPGGQYHHVKDVLSAQIILVSAHQAGTDEFYQWANSIGYRLKRVFIDEAHHIFTSDDYRPCFKLFHLITRLKKPITFLTATMSPQSLSRLCAEMLIPPSMVRVIRAPLHRPNIHYSVIKAPANEVIKRFTDVFKSTILNPTDRGIIYCTRIDLIKDLAQSLDIQYYTSKVDDQLDERANVQEKKRRFQAWRDGITPKDRWMIATLCFGEGIDFPGVRVVIHLEVNNMLRFLQETGRLGRDGLPSSSVLIYSKLPMYGEPQRDEHLGVLPMREFIQTDGCRRLTFQHFDPDAHSCSSITGTLLCDNCQLIKNSTDITVRQALWMPRDKPTLPAPAGHSTPSSAGVARPAQGLVPAVQHLSVKSVGEAIDAQYSSGMEQLRILRHIIDVIVASGCVECWVTNQHRPHPHKHPNLAGVGSKASSLVCLRRADTTHWPFCYLCWIPFREPCQHPPLREGSLHDHASCPHGAKFPSILPHAICTIYSQKVMIGNRPKNPYIDKIAERLGADVNNFTNLGTLQRWLTHDPGSADEIPRCHAFIIAFYQEFRMLPKPSGGDSAMT